eukprot:COSAG05_NODE_22082_length_267_cov_0.619048_1_plen_68_part_10
MPGLRPLSWAEGTNPKPKFIANPLYIWHLFQRASEKFLHATNIHAAECSAAACRRATTSAVAMPATGY